MLEAVKFAKMIAFLHSPVGQRVRTNNHVERTNRKLRYLEEVRYKWRQRRTIVRFVVLAIDRWRQRQVAETVVPASKQGTQRRRHQGHRAKTLT